jgi:hypothetical protein
MPQPGAALLAIWLLAGCANAAEDRAGTTSVVVTSPLDVELQDRPLQQDRGGADSERSTPDRGEPAAGTAEPTPVDEADTAADEVIRLLEAEDLYVLDLQTDTETSGDPSYVVQVRVLYGTGRGHPTEATYRVWLDLIDGAWSVASLEASP